MSLNFVFEFGDESYFEFWFQFGIRSDIKCVEILII